ncbi:SDR family NAD(P)-dependent oxidoreductase [Arthrobacter sp. NPDC089319]|uniref:SDR family NAD(P)-dependent oxidoreductase n=1 Tax=Arthrobacter sp. NPDC089319 TaxID=3155915 RepID=UPI0034367A28
MAASRRLVLVTGAASGIGRALAMAAAAEGEDLLLLDKDGPELERLSNALSQYDSDVTCCELDITDRAQVEAAMRPIKRLDVAYLNAGIFAGGNMLGEHGQIDTLDPDVWHRVIDVNLHGFFNTLQVSTSIMKSAGTGSIVVTASTSGMRAEPLASYPYVASKAAVIALVRQAALELAGFGVRINAFAPGPVRTNISGSNGMDPTKQATWDNTIPIGRFAEPDELVPLARLLAAPESSYITGSIMVADGGAGSLTQVPASALPSADIGSRFR